MRWYCLCADAANAPLLLLMHCCWGCTDAVDAVMLLILLMWWCCWCADDVDAADAYCLCPDAVNAPLLLMLRIHWCADACKIVQRADLFRAFCTSYVFFSSHLSLSNLVLCTTCYVPSCHLSDMSCLKAPSIPPLLEPGWRTRWGSKIKDIDSAKGRSQKKLQDCLGIFPKWQTPPPPLETS